MKTFGWVWFPTVCCRVLFKRGTDRVVLDVFQDDYVRKKNIMDLYYSLDLLIRLVL